ncbi:hypothetical protein ABZZ20_26925 [Streptomyces sp. NPDC006430]|uniref:hypothetical protein n=1 Tax=Streptomyces sp. NPDC006430 TaxID=3154299 RepID=UPI0033AF4D77
MADPGIVNGQQSSVTSTRNGIMALEQAFSGIMRIRTDVNSTQHALGSGYQGSDGGGFQKLLTAWDAQVDVILRNLDSMVDTLNQTLAKHNEQQGSTNTEIDSAFGRAEAAFKAITG